MVLLLAQLLQKPTIQTTQYLKVYSSGVTISNLIIDGTLGTTLHGINVYTVTNVLLDGLRLLTMTGLGRARFNSHSK